jgi:hypothetical protein
MLSYGLVILVVIILGASKIAVPLSLVMVT